MKACVLYSGGKDSSLMAVILEKLGYEVELLTMNFGVFDSFKPAAESAASIGFKHRVFKADKTIIENATNIIINDRFRSKSMGVNFQMISWMILILDVFSGLEMDFYS